MSEYRDLDLNELKIELRNAYVKKALEVQMREKEAERQIEKIRENYSVDLEKSKDAELKMRERKRELESERRRATYRKELEDQMEEKERIRKLEEERARRERKILEESDRIVDEEELSEKARRKKEVAKRLQWEKRIFEEIRRRMKRIEREEEEEEEKRNQRYIEESEKRQAELKALRVEEKNRREELIERVASMLVNCETSKLERETSLAEMIAEEMAWELVIQDREDELRRKRTRENLKKDLEEQMRFRETCARRSLERDRAFAEMVVSRAMEDEKIEKLTNEAKMRARLLYRKELLRIIEERRALGFLEQERIKLELERDRQMEEIRKRDYFEARKELLREHAQNVARYVQENSLTEEERSIVARATSK